jgi:hypothetical protein
MDIRKFAELLPASYHAWGGVNSYPRDPRRYIDVLDKVQAMTTPSNMHLLNMGVQQLGQGECYLEVGTWRGSTLIGALLGNQAEGYAIDNDTMNEHDGDIRSSQTVWRENMARFGLSTRTHYIDASVPAVWDVLDVPPVGVYLFDGDKSSEEAAYAGLWGVVPYLADEALIIVDDANEINIRRAVWRFEKEHFGHAVKFLDIPTPGNCWPCFWNGVLAIAWHA